MPEAQSNVDTIKEKQQKGLRMDVVLKIAIGTMEKCFWQQTNVTFACVKMEMLSASSKKNVESRRPSLGNLT